MDTLLALLALLVSLAALVLALRGRRAPDRPAPPTPAPPPPPSEDRAARDRLVRLEARREELQDVLRDLGERVEALESGWGEEAEALRAGFASLESAFAVLGEASEAAGREPAVEESEEPAEVAPEALVLAHLVAEGWKDVVLLPDGSSAWRVEARRADGLAKGSARLFPDGRVEARLAPPTRAFP